MPQVALFTLYHTTRFRQDNATTLETHRSKQKSHETGTRSESTAARRRPNSAEQFKPENTGNDK